MSGTATGNGTAIRGYSWVTICLARQKGLEPLTYCLEGSCSIQLSYWRMFGMERVTGIGPAYPAWKAGVLPLNYTRVSVTMKPSFILPKI